MDFLYSLYDALVSINVPSDKARAVVDAMERDMATTLATKQDLQALASREDVLLVKQDLRGLASREELLQIAQGLQQTRQELQQTRQELRGFATRDELQQVRQVLGALGERLEGLRAGLSKDIEAMQLRLTVRLGTMIAAGFGLVIAALSAWAGWLRTSVL